MERKKERKNIGRKPICKHGKKERKEGRKKERILKYDLKNK